MECARVMCEDYRYGLITVLGAASSSGDLERLQEAFHGLLAPALCDAIDNDQVVAAAYLLDRGALMRDGLFLRATRAKSYQILQFWLDRVWDINTPVGRFSLPALR